MDKVFHRQQTPQYTPEGWRSDEYSLCREEPAFARRRRSHADPDVLDQSRVLDLLGRINYKILSGNRVYIEAGGAVYKALYGAYWRSVITGIEHYLLRCEEVSGSKWLEENCAATVVDLPIVYSNDGWTTKGHSLGFMLSRD
jgi:hypothetical protein